MSEKTESELHTNSNADFFNGIGQIQTSANLGRAVTGANSHALDHACARGRDHLIFLWLRADIVHANGGDVKYGSPFGGYRLSGNGREGGRWGLQDYFEVKVLHR